MSNESPKSVEIKKVATAETNVSCREITYDVYVDGEYKATFNDILDAIDYQDKIKSEK